MKAKCTGAHSDKGTLSWARIRINQSGSGWPLAVAAIGSTQVDRAALPLRQRWYYNAPQVECPESRRQTRYLDEPAAVVNNTRVFFGESNHKLPACGFPLPNENRDVVLGRGRHCGAMRYAHRLERQADRSEMADVLSACLLTAGLSWAGDRVALAPGFYVAFLRLRRCAACRAPVPTVRFIPGAGPVVGGPPKW